MCIGWQNDIWTQHIETAKEHRRKNEINIKMCMKAWTRCKKKMKMKDQRSANNLFQLLNGEVRWQIYELLIYSTNWIVSKCSLLYMQYWYTFFSLFYFVAVVDGGSRRNGTDWICLRDMLARSLLCWQFAMRWQVYEW